MKREGPAWLCSMGAKGPIVTRDIAQAPAHSGAVESFGEGQAADAVPARPGPALRCGSPRPMSPAHGEFQVQVDWKGFR